MESPTVLADEDTATYAYAKPENARSGEYDKERKERDGARFPRGQSRRGHAGAPSTPLSRKYDKSALALRISTVEVWCGMVYLALERAGRSPS